MIWLLVVSELERMWWMEVVMTYIKVPS